ncbi:MAG: pyruvate, phosphate dikinase/phosphoenolpyruvate synthase regulator [Proteobacteria bacterium]|nr:pyruvate, phosphate dikinase/phosphoenolpyruvate synthase regulator [Pseudomonadota bacterium]MBU1739252.1 pyruvate, phosphate dikinase/phosphoenolpyruvate synthase regulator [Pseudomonadota bacterium]
MWKSKDIYYISDSTGIMITNLAQSMLCQFPEISFHEEKFPYVRSVKDAKKTLEYILAQSLGRRPIVFSTIMDQEVRNVFRSPEVEFFDVFDFLLEPLENCLEARALRVPGFSRHGDNVTMARRVEAIHFCLDHDDGTRINEFDDADVILLGVSRSGKTPVSVYLATQFGLKAANFPLTVEYLSKLDLPDGVKRNRKRAVALTTTPEHLRGMREKRYPDSRYAKLSTCTEELTQAEQIFQREKIPIINSTGKSIEELATQVTQEIGLAKKPGSVF